MAKSWKPALAAVGLYALLLGLFVAAHRGDLSALVCVGAERLREPPYDAVTTSISPGGYDGQFYYAIARAPWQRQDVGIDAPAARHLRILYPALSWALSGGDKYLLLWIMPLVNLLAIGGLVWLGAVWALHHGLNPWWALLLPAAVNDGLPAVRNLTDVLSTTAVAALLVAWLLRWPWWSVTLAGAAALFAREQNAVVVGIVVAASAWQRHYRPAAGLLAALALWGGWVLGCRSLYGQWPLLPATGNTGAPFLGWLFAWNHPAGFHGLGLVNKCCLLLLLFQVGVAGALVPLHASRVLILTAAAGAGLVVIGGVFVYGDYWSFMRVFAWLPLALWLGCVPTRHTMLLAALALPAFLPLHEVVRPLLHLVP